MKTMQKLAAACIIAAGTMTLNAQNVGISPAPGSPPDPSAGLDVNFSNKGVLIPRVGLTGKNDNTTIPSPATSLLIYNNGSGGFTPTGYYYWNGSEWVRLLVTGTPSDAWLTLGNSGTLPGTHFLGTTDNVDLVFKTNNLERMRINNVGNVGIGLTNPEYKLDVNGNIRFPYGSAILSGDSWLPNNKVLETGWDNTINRDYVYLYTVGTNTQNTIPKIAILHEGKVGIGTTNPKTRLHIKDNLDIGIFNGASIRLEYSHLSGAAVQFMNAVTGNYWNIGAEVNMINPEQDFHIARWSSGNLRNVFKIYTNTLSPQLMSEFFSRTSGVSGNGTNNDGPTNVVIQAGTNTARFNDWPNGWQGGLSTYEICGRATYMTTYSTRSDRSYKKNIKELTYEELKDKFMALIPVQYYINTKELMDDEPDRLRFGFIANDVEKIFPNLVINAGLPANIKRGLEYDGIIPILVKIVQEQQKKIEYLERKIETLESHNQK
jgi:hypothetical protein